MFARIIIIHIKWLNCLHFHSLLWLYFIILSKSVNWVYSVVKSRTDSLKEGNWCCHVDMNEWDFVNGRNNGRNSFASSGNHAINSWLLFIVQERMREQILYFAAFCFLLFFAAFVVFPLLCSSFGHWIGKISFNIIEFFQNWSN